MRTKKVFCVSERSLIQTIGRGCTQRQGGAQFFMPMLGPDRWTGLLVKLIVVVRNSWRTIQAQGIVPVSISKTINDVMEGARVTSGGSKRSTKTGISRQETTEIPQSPKALGKLLAELEKRMLDHAQNLEFEEAAAVS